MRRASSIILHEEIILRIEHLKTRIVSLPIDPPIRTPVHYIEAVDNVLVEITTDDGITGVAYLWCFGRERAKGLEAFVRDLFCYVKGMDAMQREAVQASLWRETNFLGRTGAAWIAASAIDTALWDIAGKALNLPVWKLLGGTDRPVKAYAGGFFLSDTIDAIVQEAHGRVKEGFRALKMRCGAKSWQEDIDRVAAIRDAVGPDVDILVDVVQGWTVDRALKLGRELERFDLTYIEDPIAFDDIEGMAKLAAELDIPIAAGENDYGRSGFRRLIEARAVDIAMIDLQRAGGISEWMKIAAMAEAWRMPVVPHVFHEISIHMLAATPSALYLEYMSWWEPLFNERLTLDGGTFRPPETAGLGISFNEAEIDRLMSGAKS
jgi:L-alanine-DL-glutamate epimerase-like enolase superfamily enzyme